MIYLLVGALLVFLIYRGAGRRLVKRYADWRIATAALAVGLFAAAAFVGLRGGWGKALVLAVIGASLAASARWPRQVGPASPGRMSEREARAALGVGPEASADEIKAAYARLIQRVHPDKGGAEGLAAHLNFARDVLLNTSPRKD